MEVRDRPRAASWVWAITAALCAAIVVAMAVRAVRADGGFDDPAVKSLALALLAILLGMTIGALVAWRRDQRAAGALVRAALRARDEADGSIDVVRSELDAERARSRGLQQRHAVEARWVDELRQKVAELHKRHGALGAADVGELVLRVAVELTEASRGLLLEQRGDSLEVAHAHGFDPDDPAGSRIIERLARQTLRRDETLRDDDPDGELDNLVAIPVYVTGELTGVVVCADRPGGFAEVEDEVLLALGDHAGAVLQHGRLRGELRSAYLGTVSVLAGALEAKDPFLRGHCDDVARLVAAVADRVGVDPGRREELVFGSLLHDVGKLGISERILLKPGALTPEERAVVEMHPRIGFRLVEQVPALRSIAPAVLHHHERFDGGGYPAGLRGTDIPLEARIVCVADCFSAMTSDRPYRSALSVSEACDELVSGAGTQFDPQVVTAFVEEIRRLDVAPAPPSPLDDGDLRAMRQDGESLLGASAASVIDSVTLLYSHRHLLETAVAEAERAALQGTPFTVVAGELRDLPQINRDRGYRTGDEALRAAARAFETAAAVTTGAVAGRLSGRTLALVVPGDGHGAAERIAAALHTEARVELACATWRSGERGEDVIARARRELRVAAA